VQQAILISAAGPPFGSAFSVAMPFVSDPATRSGLSCWLI